MIFYSDITVHSKLTIGVDDTGHDVQFFGATAGSYMLWDESADALLLTDSTPLSIGDGSDLQIKHNGTDSLFNNNTGDIYLTNKANNKDIIFQSDDNSGGVATYFALDGSTKTIEVSVPINIGANTAGHDVKFYAAADGRYMIWDVDDNSLLFTDNATAKWGNGGDLQLSHDGSNSKITNAVGNLSIINYADDADIVFESDNGVGGVETYFFLDGSASSGSPFTVFPDNSQIALGTSNDMLLYHDGSNSYITNKTGALKIATETSGIALTIGHTTSETTIADNLTITGDLAIGGDITSVGDDVSIGDDLILTSVNGALRWNGTHGGSGGITYEDTGGSARYAMQFAQDTVIMSNRAANGTVAIKANTSTAGAAGEVTVATFTDTEMTCLATNVTGGMTVVESSEPSNPPSGSAVIWYAEGVLYAKNSDGTPGVVAAFEGG